MAHACNLTRFMTYVYLYYVIINRMGLFVSPEQLHRIGVDRAIAGRQNLAAVCAGTALPVGDNAARAFNDRNEGRHVPSVETRFDNQIDKAEGQSAKDIAVASEAGHADRLLDAAKGVSFLGSEIGFR